MMKKLVLFLLTIALAFICNFFIFDSETKDDSNNVTYEWGDITTFSYDPHLKLVTRTLNNGNGVFGGCFVVDNYKHLKQFNKEFAVEIACLYWDSNSTEPPILQLGQKGSEYAFKDSDGKLSRKIAPSQYFENDADVLHSVEVFFSNLPKEKIAETMDKIY